MKYIQSKIKELEWSQHCLLIFRRSKAAKSEFGDGILPEFKRVQTFITVIINCKKEEDPSENEGNKVVNRFSHYKYIGIFPDAQGLPTVNSLVGS